MCEEGRKEGRESCTLATKEIRRAVCKNTTIAGWERRKGCKGKKQDGRY
jgi:hypothetical protein